MALVEPFLEKCPMLSKVYFVIKFDPDWFTDNRF